MEKTEYGRTILKNLASRLSNLLGNRFETDFSNLMSTRPIGEQILAPTQKVINTSISSALMSNKTMFTTVNCAWNPVVAIYHDALTSALIRINELEKRVVSKKKPLKPSSSQNVVTKKAPTPVPPAEVSNDVASYASVAATPPVTSQQTVMQKGKTKQSPSDSKTTAQSGKRVTTPGPGITVFPSPIILAEMRELWECPTEPLFKNSKWIQCAKPTCSFCRDLFKDTIVTECSLHLKGHIEQNCHKSGWYPHVGRRLWSCLVKPHNEGITYNMQDVVREHSIRAFAPQRVAKRSLPTGDSIQSKRPSIDSNSTSLDLQPLTLETIDEMDSAEFPPELTPIRGRGIMSDTTYYDTDSDSEAESIGY